MNIKELFNECIKGPWVTSNKNDVQFKMNREGKTVYIYFQGTVSKIDWKQNFKFISKKYEDLYIHKGFLENYLIVKDNINYILEHLRYEIDKIIISGYSQGAAIASLCYYDLINKYINVSCIMFGSPRVFIKNKKDFSNIYNYQTFGDIITLLPLWIFGYRHIGNVMKLGKKRLLPLPKYHYIDYYNKYL